MRTGAGPNSQAFSQGYGGTGGQIGVLRAIGSVDAVLTSPPFLDRSTEPHVLGSGKPTRADGDSAGRNKGDYHYGQSEGLGRHRAQQVHRQDRLPAGQTGRTGRGTGVRGGRLPASVAGAGDVRRRAGHDREAQPAGAVHRRRRRPHPARHPPPGVRTARRGRACTTWPGDATASGSSTPSRSAASARRRRSAATPTIRRWSAGNCCGWPTAPPAGCARPDGRSHGHPVGAFRRLHRADPFGDPAHGHRRHRGDLRRRRSRCTRGWVWTGPGCGGSGSGSRG